MLSRVLAGEEVAHALQRLEDVLRRIGVGQPHEALAIDAPRLIGISARQYLPCLAKMCAKRPVVRFVWHVVKHLAC